MSRPSAIPLDELRRRYDAIGKIEDMPFERTYYGRCSHWAGFLDYGPSFSEAIRSGGIQDHETAHNPALVALVLEAWPGEWSKPKPWPRLGLIDPQ
ncbi:MAG TPA: hypothetical protein DCY89_07075 [Gammaproteobacteria bacterium]|nr:hypothetical protein [Gammaproteobacteria bacterium]